MIVYHEDYNIQFFGIEKFHPFDSCKYRKIFAGISHLSLPTLTTDRGVADVSGDVFLIDVRDHT